MTYDEMIARGLFGTGKHSEMRQRMAEYMVDGKRLGAISWPSETGSLHSRRLSKDAGEILGSASILSLLGFDGVVITSEDSTGRKLERPDLDVKFKDGTEIGVEQADVSPPDEYKHDAESDQLRTYILTLMQNDASFLTSFGLNNVTVFLSSHLVGRLQIQSKNERVAIQAELEQFLRTEEHAAGGTAIAFSAAYPTLYERGATWHSSAFPEPTFELGHVGGDGLSVPTTQDVARVLAKHGQSAAKPDYRKLPAWITMLMTSRWEFFRDTLDAVAKNPPLIAPFERGYLQDDTGRVLEIRSDGTAAFVGMFLR